MRVFVLALDGLEYFLVKKWGLKNLMQARYGMFKVPEVYYHKKEKVPYTPMIWTTIITGKTPSEHKITDWWSYGRVLDWVRYKPPFVWIKNKRNLLMKLGIKPHVVKKDDWGKKVKTIFEMVKPSIPLFIPAYNEPTEYHIRLSKAMLYGGLRRYVETIKEIHKERVNILLNELWNPDWKLFMVWLDIADLLGHVCYHKCPDELMNAYFELDNLVVKIKERLKEKPTWFLIISDHGMEDSGDGVTGNHSDHAFWSVNTYDDWRPRDFIDIHKRVLEVIGVER